MRIALALITSVIVTGQAAAAGDVAKGEQVYKKCMACHSIKDAANKVGPSLLGITAKKPGTVAGYKYSAPFKAYADTLAAWDDASLDAWIADPKAVAKGTKMVFPGIKDAQERADVIAFIKSKM